ncbi:uncharacterized protein BJX67DRAFT_380690 [Aspergillus lucknowensis]|uniref:Integral membrane protein n=1 Tax=Aspergillus lucknowensis TaxID=176173 RepID=A0ABR4LTE0_9EURO
MDVSVFFFGLFLGFFIFTMEGVIRQTIQIWKRTRSLTQVYLWFIWIESVVNLVFASITRLQLDGVIPVSLAFYTGTVLLWAIQTQLLSQIIANRISLIMVSHRKSLQLRWGLFIAIGIINLAVAGIWIPAHLESASDFQIRLNYIFENVEKSFFLVVDLGLNLYFIYLVRYRLIADGLNKYWTLYKFNCGFVAISTAMDACLLGLLSLPNQYAYVQFAPVTYTVKLYLELKMAQLISKVVRRSMNRVDDSSTSQHHSSNRGALSHSFRNSIISKKPMPPMPTPMGREPYENYDPGSHEMNTHVSSGGGEHGEASHGKRGGSEGQGIGILKTITTVVETESREGSSEGSPSHSLDGSRDHVLSGL